MLSDESSSDSETGRFKGTQKTKEDKSSNRNEDSLRSSGRNRHSQGDRFRREFDRRRDERDNFDKHSREQRFSRHSPIRRRHSRDRSPRRRSSERHRQTENRTTSKTRERSGSRDRKKNSRPLKSPENRAASKTRERSGSRDRRKLSRTHKSPEPRSRQKSSEPTSWSHRSTSRSHRSPETKSRSHKSPEPKARIQKPSEALTIPRKSSESLRDLKDEIRRTLEPVRKSPAKRKSPISHSRKSRDKSVSPDYKGKRSEVFIPATLPTKRKSESPIVVEEHDSDKSEEVQLGSYYSMIPAVVKEKSESSEIDSSDDERLRAKLLNLEKELQKTRKKKHKKKHKRKSSRSSKDRVVEPPTVEVTSTTDIQDKIKDDSSHSQEAVPEVSSTQKNAPKESSEEGEISSGDDQSSVEYDPSDLRHKLRKSKPKIDSPDVCGPALPPHLEKRMKQSSTDDIEGPILPPHLQNKSKNIGPSIPDDIRRVLAEKDREVIKYESSDEDGGIGPLPPGADDRSEAHRRLEERALDIKIKSIEGRSMDSQKVKSREQWMLELPEGKAKYLGLEARGFRPKEGPDMSDRSSWTDTPEEKARKAAGLAKEEDPDTALRRDARSRIIVNRDDEQEIAVKKHKKKHKREESLLDLHQKKLKKKKKKEEKEEGKKERRPFSRDVDLQVNRFDEAQKKSIIKKAQDLNSRFGRGEAKFL